MIFIHLLVFAMIWLSFPEKIAFNLQLAPDSFLDENSQVCSSPYPCLFILLGHPQQTTFFKSRRQNTEPEANCFPRHLYTSTGFASCLLHRVSQATTSVPQSWELAGWGPVPYNALTQSIP